MPVVTPNISRGRRLLLALFVIACLVVLGALSAWGWVLLDGWTAGVLGE
ncbi:hypothetical protein [Streptomyces anulatus]|nr:hypothetical protein OHA54_31270 [Streptomyces anulatus]WTE06763.1 hypothetical protein OH765_31370 [Streptomyces anulatus]